LSVLHPPQPLKPQLSQQQL